MPFVGSFFTMMKFSVNSTNHPVVDLCEELYYKESEKGVKKIVPAFVGIAGQQDVGLIVARPEAVQELFLSKNKYFDKHPRSS